MNRPMLAAAAVAALTATAGVTAADAATRQLAWAGSDSLDVSVPGRVVITQGAAPRIVVSGPSKAVSRVYFDGERLRFKRTWFMWTGWNDFRGLKVEITTPGLQRLAVHSGSNVRLVDIASSALALSVHSGADLDGRVSCNSMTASVHSGADLRLSGRADRLDLSVHSGADADLGSLAVEHANVRAHSGADAILNPRLSVKANAHSGADIHLLQRPALVETEIHSGGGVRIP